MCVTCGARLPWQELHCGHYIHNKLDFSELNLNAQCNACNTYRAGEQGKYTIYLQRKYGYGIAETLYKMAAREHRCKHGFAGMEYTEELLQRLIEYYTNKLNRLK